MINPPVCEATNDSSTVEELFSNNQRLIGFFLSRYSKPPHMSDEEYHSELLIAFWKSCRTYDKSIAKFSTYAFRGMFMARGRMRKAYTRTMDKKIYSDITKINIQSHKDTDEDAVEAVNRKDYLELINGMVRYLSPNQKLVVMRIMAGESRTEIASDLGKSPHTVAECYRHAVRRMQVIARRKGIKCPI